jgi:hypothetical protein
MRTTPRTRGLVQAARSSAVIALVFVGFACGTSEPLPRAAKDSGANSGSPSDASSMSDSPSSTTGGAGGATAATSGGESGTGGGAATGGTIGTGGASGNLPDAPTVGIGDAAEGGGRDGGPRDAPIDNHVQPCGSPCTEAGGETGAADTSSGGTDGSISSTGGTSGTGGSVSPPILDASCGGLVTSTSHAQADVLLVLDRSGSMNNSIAQDCYCDTASAGTSGTLCANTANCITRWTSLTTALSATLSSSPNIRWGLKLYASPAGSACTVTDGSEVPIGDTSAAAIEALISSVSPSGSTPTAAAVTAATAYLQTVSDAGKKVILLATDGQPNCPSGGSSSSSDVQGALNAITSAASAGFLVYVIGIGPSVGNLDAFA